jgi:hypothetical protein
MNIYYNKDFYNYKINVLSQNLTAESFGFFLNN